MIFEHRYLFLVQVRKIFSHSFKQICFLWLCLSLFLLGSLSANLCILHAVPEVLKIILFFFPLCYFDWVIYTIVYFWSLMYSSLLCNLLLTPPSEVFISVIIFFSFDYFLYFLVFCWSSHLLIYTFSLSSDHFYYSNFQFSHSVMSDSL